MPAKKVTVQLTQGRGFKTECKAGKHTVYIDQPAAAGGTDTGPTPLDYQLLALGGCIAAIGRIIANQRRLPVHGFEIAVEADIDTDGLLGKASGNRVGFSGIGVRVKIVADLSDVEKASLLHEIDSRCPISDNLQNDTPVTITLIT
jgi:uncharacterized OsmC-like protein